MIIIMTMMMIVIVTVTVNSNLNACFLGYRYQLRGGVCTVQEVPYEVQLLTSILLISFVSYLTWEA